MALRRLLYRPRSILRLILVGFALVALPLLIAFPVAFFLFRDVDDPRAAARTRAACRIAASISADPCHCSQSSGHVQARSSTSSLRIIGPPRTTGWVRRSAIVGLGRFDRTGVSHSRTGRRPQSSVALTMLQFCRK